MLSDERRHRVREWLDQRWTTVSDTNRRDLLRIHPAEIANVAVYHALGSYDEHEIAEFVRDVDLWQRDKRKAVSS